MSLFFDALLVTLGIAAALVGAVLLYKSVTFFFRFSLEYFKYKKRRALNLEASKVRKERAIAEKAKLVQETQDFVKRNSEIAQLVEALEATPYSYGTLTADKQQNKKRGKIQNELRKLVPNDRYRKVIYEMTK